MPEKLTRLIDLAAKSTKFGQLDMVLGVHDGQIKYVVGNEHSSKNFSTAGDQEAVEFALQAVAKERNFQSTGALTITFEFTAGNIKRIHIHKAFRHNLTEQNK